MPSNCCWAPGESPVWPTVSRFSTSTIFDSERLVPWLCRARTLGLQPRRATGDETTFSNTAGSSRESSTRKSICASTATSAAPSRTARAFFSTSGQTPARGDGAALQQILPARIISRTTKSRTPMAAYHHVRKYRRYGRLPADSAWQLSMDLPGGSTAHPNEERSCFIGASERPLVFRCLQFRPEDLSACESGDLANVPACPGRDAVGLGPVFQHHSRSRQALRDRRPAPRNVGGRQDGHAGWTRHSNRQASPRTFGTPPSSRIRSTR